MKALLTTIRALGVVAVVAMTSSVSHATALSVARATASKNPGPIKSYLMKASTTIYAGGMVMVDSDGLALPAAASASNHGVIGVALQTKTSASTGTYKIQVQEGWFLFAGTTLEQADVGVLVYAEDDQTIDETAGANEPLAGLLMEYVGASSGWVHVSSIYQNRTAISTDATTMTGDLTLAGGAGGLTMSDSASSILVPDNDSTALDFGSTGTTAGLRYSSADNAEYFLFGVGQAASAVSITGATTLDASDCGKPLFVSAGIDTASITLPALSVVPSGCVLRFFYVGADAGALLDISPNAADGIEGTCTLAASVVTFSGTDDADIGLTKATGLTGDTITLVSGNADDWYVQSCAGIWANN
jgi:hypothetical protein